MNRRRIWIPFLLYVALVVVGLAGLTSHLLRLERATLEARLAAEQEGALRLALWRLDSWFAPYLARENARPPAEYLPFVSTVGYGDPGVGPDLCGPVEVPSSLLFLDSDLAQLHFELGADGVLRSPQVPQADLLTRAVQVGFDADASTGRRTQLVALGDVLGAPAEVEKTVQNIVSCVMAVMPPEPTPIVVAPPTLRAQEDEGPRQKAISKSQWLQRAASNAETQNYAIDPPKLVTGMPVEAEVGPFVPMWLGEDLSPPLVFVRRVGGADGVRIQGFVCNWERLRTGMLDEVRDEFPGADLVPVDPVQSLAPDAAVAERLAAVPAVLQVRTTPVLAATVWNASRVTLLLAWGLALVGFIAVGLTLHWSLRFAEKRTRFANAVTHELRTPLTTFRMYAEMLADDMVVEPEQRKAYLNTLKCESGRLARLVENVLAYARLERGGTALAPEATSLGDLLEGMEPSLVTCAAAADMQIGITIDEPGATLATDAEAVGRILHNLVENAAKYARDAGDRTVHIETTTSPGRIAIDVRDHGPGIEPHRARTIFTPYERGGDAVRTVAGIGLGLPLARALARRLGGDLELRSGNGGAWFRLELPR